MKKIGMIMSFIFLTHTGHGGELKNYRLIIDKIGSETFCNNLVQAVDVNLSKAIGAEEVLCASSDFSGISNDYSLVARFRDEAKARAFKQSIELIKRSFVDGKLGVTFHKIEIREETYSPIFSVNKSNKIVVEKGSAYLLAQPVKVHYLSNVDITKPNAENDLNQIFADDEEWISVSFHHQSKELDYDASLFKVVDHKEHNQKYNISSIERRGSIVWGK